MKGAAQRWMRRKRFEDWDDFQEQFTRRFGETRETAVARLTRCSQRYDETPKAFADRFLENAERAGRAEDEALVYQFLGKLRPQPRPAPAPRAPSAAAPVSAADVEALTQSFQRLELNMRQMQLMMQDKDKENRHLRYALVQPISSDQWIQSISQYQQPFARSQVCQ